MDYAFVPGSSSYDKIVKSFLKRRPNTVLIDKPTPDTRWWRFEDGRVNFGDIKPDTTDLSKLLFIEFGLVYANDWFMVPFTLPAGSIATVKGLSVTNVFGEKLWVDAAGKGLDESWKRWNMFSLNKKGKQREPADSSLLVLPTVEKIQEGKPLEEVIFIRDEVANMVWAIEKKIPLVIGTPKNGAEAAHELNQFYQKYWMLKLVWVPLSLMILNTKQQYDMKS